MSEPNTTVHKETTQLPPDNGGNPAGQPAATAAEPKNAQPTAEQPAPAPTKVEEPAVAPTSEHPGLIARAKENWDLIAAGVVIGGVVGGTIVACCKKDSAPAVVI